MRSKRRTPKKPPEQTESLMDFWLRNRGAVDEAIDRDVERSCESKDRYPTREQARAVAAMNGMADVLFTYQCRYCGDWHLTRQNR
ncbi:MAG TPA: hypothetical protein VN603_10790 [Candidatus Acidoferrales bacterium]|jgi:hypothetical protein|nr:hypothetical protein [Candidatus Acidoferrales bacterium]